MPWEEDFSKKLKSFPDVLVSLFWAAIITLSAFFFVYLAEFLKTLPFHLDVPWLLVFLAIFFFILVRKRIRILRADMKPSLS